MPANHAAKHQDAVRRQQRPELVALHTWDFRAKKFGHQQDNRQYDRKHERYDAR